VSDPLSRFRAALRLLSPDHITPTGRRILERVLDAEESRVLDVQHSQQPTKGKTMGDTAYVLKYPDCDICKHEQDRITEAHYDGQTLTGQWGYMCEVHFASRGTGLGTGKGQRLIVGEKPVPTREERRKQVQQAAQDGDWDAMEEAVGDGDIAEWL
jgi:hypothetical protein